MRPAHLIVLGGGLAQPTMAEVLARSCQMWRLGPKGHPLRTRQFGAAIEGPIGTGPLTLSAYIANIFR